MTVYTSEHDVPCEYEVIRTVRAQSSEGYRSARDFLSAQSRLLGRAGMRAGADAVLARNLESGPLTVDKVGGSGSRSRSSTGMPTSTFEGRAIRYIEGTCGGAAFQP